MSSVCSGAVSLKTLRGVWGLPLHLNHLLYSLSEVSQDVMVTEGQRVGKGGMLDSNMGLSHSAPLVQTETSL